MENIEFDVETCPDLWKMELKLAEDLRKCCDVKKKEERKNDFENEKKRDEENEIYVERECDLKESANILHKLGLVYRKKALYFLHRLNLALTIIALVGHSKVSCLIRNRLSRILTSIRFALIRSAALMNAAIVRKPSNAREIHKDLDNLHLLVLNLAKASCCEYKLSGKVDFVLEKLRFLRKATEANLNKLQNIPENISIQEEFQRQQGKIDFMESLQSMVSEYYIDVMSWVSNQCVEIMGKPPCGYAVVGMGSLAKKEITPYSDFEHVIVLDDDILERFNENSDEYQSVLEYFRWFCVTFFMVILGLGETPLYNVKIPSLNSNQKKKYDWFYDKWTPSGISFDSMAIYASHFPLGRQEKTQKKTWTTELIRPVSKMVEYLDKDVDLKDGYHLANVLSNTCFVSGDKVIYDCLVEMSGMKMNSWRKSGNEIFLKQLEEDLNNFSVYDNLENTLSTFSSSFNIKQVFFRTSTLFVSALGRMKFGYSGENCPFRVVKKLKESQVLTPEAAHELAYAVAISCEVRLKLYLKNKRQEDSSRNLNYFSPLAMPAALDIKKSIGEESLLSYIEIVGNLQHMIRTESWNYELTKHAPHYKIYTAFCLHLHSKAIRLYKSMVSKSTSGIRIPVSVILLVADSMYVNQMYDEALNLLQDTFEALDWHKIKLHIACLIIQCMTALDKKDDEICAFMKENHDRLNPEEDFHVMLRCYDVYGKYLLEVVDDPEEALQVYVKLSDLLSDFRLLEPTLKQPVRGCVRKHILGFGAGCSFGIGECHLRNKNYDIAIENFQEGIRRYEGCGIQCNQYLCYGHTIVGKLFMDKKNYTVAKAYFGTVFQILEGCIHEGKAAPVVGFVKERLSECTELQKNVFALEWPGN
ncbi:unnamed protein product [Clavelina lepadiformis]|uniref:Protein-PII uridylyltransferase N-terminal domain-containing protein n=1 Tax=Clavelina lepadiformis TaxID=159417 RepID=A0ABP0G1B2_CLALP